MLIAHASHAEAGVWVINEKGLIANVGHLPVDSHEFAETAAAILASWGRRRSNWLTR